MKIALLSMALLGSNLVPASDKVPELRVEALCQSTVATDKAMGLDEAQSFGDCMRDETTAQTQLRPLWSSTSASVRDSCEGEATSGGIQSYVDLLTCIQMTDTANSLTKGSGLKGASKNRNKTSQGG
jgi:hypothetical protein